MDTICNYPKHQELSWSWATDTVSSKLAQGMELVKKMYRAEQDVFLPNSNY